MKTLFVALIAVLGLFAQTAQADLKANFNKMNKTYKGPFGQNVIQGDRGRGEILQGGGASGKRQFQAAFRNELARETAEQYAFYLGNLFTTNYYELTGEYVFGKPYGSHPNDHARLLAQAANVIGKASTMVRHWVIEKHYVMQFPQSEIAKGFTLRGISDLENEQEYANYFFNFYVSAINDDYQYLPAFILVNRSPIVESASLARARDLVAQAYDSYSMGWGSDSNSIKEMYKIRNAIHNQLSKEVIGQIDRFLKAYPEFQNDGYFSQIRKILVEYYGIDASKISGHAKNLGMNDIKAAADRVLKKDTKIDGLLELSAAAANWRTNLATQIPFEKRAKALALLADTAKVLNKEISGMKPAEVKNPKVLEAIVNTIYLEGFLIKDNWTYFQTEIRTSAAPAQLLSDIIDASTATLAEAFRPAFTQWVELEPKMQNFMDSTIKGSALNTASGTIEKLNKP